MSEIAVHVAVVGGLSVAVIVSIIFSLHGVVKEQLKVLKENSEKVEKRLDNETKKSEERLERETAKVEIRMKETTNAVLAAVNAEFKYVMQNFTDKIKDK